MSEPPKCPRCGTPLPAATIRGLCPACLLQQGAAADSASQPSASFEPPEVSEIARLFPQLEIVSLLGKGGMGAVYKARQPALDRFVALKILAVRADGSGFADRFTREARALARLSHPAIVGIYEFGEAGGLHYLIMEYVDGANLRQLEQAGRLSPREALQIVPQICDALQYAHDEGVVHRDIKPENVLIDRKGRVKIADFGLAKILGLDGETMRLTGEGHVMGTPHYMAPEQIEHPLEVDHRADIYSLGVVFYEMLTGELPLGKFAPPSRKVSVDLRLDEVVLRALEKEPEMRFQRASEVKTRLDSIRAEDAPAPANQAAIPTRKSRWKILAIIWAAIFIPAVYAVLADGWAPAALWMGIGVSAIALLVVGVANMARRAAKAPMSAFAVIGTVLACLFIGFVGLVALALIIPAISKQRSPRMPAAPVLWAKLDDAVERFRADNIELAGVSEYPSKGKPWWKADGAPSKDGPFDDAAISAITRFQVKPDEIARAFVFRTRDPEPADDVTMRMDPPSGNVASAGLTANGKLVPGLSMVVAAFPKAARTVSFDVGLASGPWETIGTVGGNGMVGTRLLGEQWYVTGLEPIETKNGDTVANAVVNTSALAQMRIVAVDAAGAEHLSSKHQRFDTAPLVRLTATFSGLPLAKIGDLRLEARIYRWARFSSVALNPTTSAPAEAGANTPE